MLDPARVGRFWALISRCKAPAQAAGVALCKASIGSTSAASEGPADPRCPGLQARYDLLAAKSGASEAEQLQAQLVELERQLQQAREAGQQLTQQLESQLLQMQVQSVKRSHCV